MPSPQKELGINAIWFTPIYPSPQVDNGCDISDYRGIAPVYNTIEDYNRRYMLGDGFVCIFAFGENKGFAWSSPREQHSPGVLHLHYSSPITTLKKKERRPKGLLSIFWGG